MKRYQTLLFDLFNTVALWHPERMPKLTWDGHTGPSTLGELGKILATERPDLGFTEFHQAFTQSNEALATERGRTQREIPSRERFSRALQHAGEAPGDATEALAETLSLRHMDILAGASAIPASHAALLGRLKSRYALALVSNFDHQPTALRILDRDGVSDHFSHIVVSDGHGWRKPHLRIFADTLQALGHPADAALFIGDSVEDDIIGAQAAGIDIAWVNARDKELPDGVPEPTYRCKAITELETLLLADA